MEESFSMSGVNSIGRYEVKVSLDFGRELNDTDSRNIRECIENLVGLINGETLRLKPETKIKYEETKAELLGAFGERKIFAKEIPNGYCDCNICKQTSPWFEVTTDKGVIKIGWRKRVINIDWSESQINETAQELFPDEDVTKYDKDIHAWGADKAKEYIEVILK